MNKNSIPLRRAIEGFDKETDEFVWSKQIDERTAREIAEDLNLEDDNNFNMEYYLTGDVLEKATEIVGFEAKSNIDYVLSTSRDD